MSHRFSGVDDDRDMIFGTTPVDPSVVADHESASLFIVGNDHAFAEGREISLEFHGSVHKAHIEEQ